MDKLVLHILVLFSVTGCLLYVIINIKKNEQLNIFSWYIFGVLISYHLPFILINLAGAKFNYEPENGYGIIISFIIILITIIETYLAYKFFIEFKTILFKRKKFKFNRLNYTRKSWINRVFVFLIKIYSLYLCLYSAYLLLSYRSVIANNDHIRRLLLPLIYKQSGKGILLLIPLAISIYYLNSYFKTNSRKTLLLFFVYHVMALFPIMMTGQRTALLLVVILPLLEFYRIRKSSKILVYTLFGSTLVLSIYSLTFKRTLVGQENILMKVVGGDFDMNWLLWFSLDHTSILTSKIISYPGSGFFYTLFAFIPRKIASFKGYNSNAEFTVFFRERLNLPLGASSIEELSWGYKFGQIVETVLNLGYIGIVILPMLYGFILAVLELCVRKHKLTYGMSSMISFFISFLTLFTNITLFVPILIIQIILNKYSKKYST